MKIILLYSILDNVIWISYLFMISHWVPENFTQAKKCDEHLNINMLREQMLPGEYLALM